jgi:hypothetical protein
MTDENYTPVSIGEYDNKFKKYIPIEYKGFKIGQYVSDGERQGFIINLVLPDGCIVVWETELPGFIKFEKLKIIHSWLVPLPYADDGWGANLFEYDLEDIEREYTMMLEDFTLDDEHLILLGDVLSYLKNK